MADLMDKIIHELLYQNILVFVVGGLLLFITFIVQKFGLVYQFFHKVSE